jgi:cell division protein FtsW
MDTPQPEELSTVEEAKKYMNKKRTDIYIWGIYFALITFSVIELFSASIQEVTAADIYGPIMRHMKFIGIGLLIMLGLQRIHWRHMYYMVPIYVFCSLVAMGYVLLFGVDINGARRGMMIFSMLLLPAEFLKLAVALGIAYIVSRCQIHNTHDITTKGVVSCVGFVLLCSGMLFLHGLTNTLLVLAISMTMMAVGFGGKKFGYVILLFFVIGGCAVTYKMYHKSEKGPTEREIMVAQLNREDVNNDQVGEGRGSTWHNRVENYMKLDKYNDPMTDENKQAQLSFIAQAHGGVRGVGIGKSRENTRLPLAFSDYIFAIVVEEMGMVFGIFLLTLYLWLLMHAGRLVMNIRATFPSLLVIGCAITITYQALFHIAIVTGVFPVSGQPLPLFSKGGSSVIATSIALGIMLCVSRSAVRIEDGSEAQEQELQTLPEQLRKDNPAQRIVSNE